MAGQRNYAAEYAKRVERERGRAAQEGRPFSLKRARGHATETTKPGIHGGQRDRLYSLCIRLHGSINKPGSMVWTGQRWVNAGPSIDGLRSTVYKDILTAARVIGYDETVRRLEGSIAAKQAYKRKRSRRGRK